MGARKVLVGRFLARQAAAVTMLSIAVVVGVVIGVTLDRFGAVTGIGEIVGSSIGAAIGVFGAVWAANHRDTQSKHHLQALLAGAVQEILSAANSLAEIEQDLGFEADAKWLAANRIRGVLARWEHLRMYSPYQDVGNYSQTHALFDVDAACVTLNRLLEVVEEPAKPIAPGFAMMRPKQWSVKQLVRVAEDIAGKCNIAMSRLIGVRGSEN